MKIRFLNQHISMHLLYTLPQRFTKFFYNLFLHKVSKLLFIDNILSNFFSNFSHSFNSPISNPKIQCNATNRNWIFFSLFFVKKNHNSKTKKENLSSKYTIKIRHASWRINLATSRENLSLQIDGTMRNLVSKTTKSKLSPQRR